MSDDPGAKDEEPRPLGEVQPTSPPVEYYQPARLSILHLLIWTAVAALLLGMWVRPAGSVRPSNPTEDIARRLFLALFAITHSAGLVGAGLILWDKLRHVPGRLQPGHWLLLLLGAPLVWLLGLRFLVSAWRPLLQYPTAERMAADAAGSLAVAVAGLVVAARLRDRASWRLVLGILCLQNTLDVLKTVLRWVSTTRSIPYDSPLSWLFYATSWCSSLAEHLYAVLAVFAMLRDLVQRTRRDHLHWLGAGLAVFYVLQSWGQVVVFLLTRP